MLKPMKDNGTIRFYDEVNFVYYELGINNEPINIGDTKKSAPPYANAWPGTLLYDES